jgi:hypothetical protein
MVVSMLHTVFDVLAFKNDIGFWKNNKSMEGLSARRWNALTGKKRRFHHHSAASENISHSMVECLEINMDAA